MEARPTIAPEAEGEIGERHRHEDAGFDEEAAGRFHPHLLPHETIGGKGQGDGQRDIGHMAKSEALESDRGERDDDRHDLQRPLPLAEEEHADDDVGDRVDEIAEAGFDELPVGDRPDVDQPVGGEQHRGEDEGPHDAEVAQRRPHFGDAAGDDEDDADEQQRPDGAVGDDGECAGFLQCVEEQRQEAPQHVADEAGDEPRPGAARGVFNGDGGGFGQADRPLVRGTPRIRSSNPAPRCQWGVASERNQTGDVPAI